MPYGYSHRTVALVGGLALVVAGGALVTRVLRRSDENACPAAYGSSELATLGLWEGAGGIGAVPEVAGARPEDLRPLADPEDTAACARLRALLPDTLHFGLAAPYTVAFYQLGDLYVIPVTPNLRQSEIEAMERGDWTADRAGATYVVGSDFELIASYEQ
jgi:hypothetical protein